MNVRVHPEPGDVSLMSVFTLILWLGCAVIGGLGFVLPYTRPSEPKPQPPPVQVEMLRVELTQDDSQPASAAPSAVAPTENTPPQSQVPPAIAVAEPSPAVAFALPVAGPVRVVERRQAAYVQPKETAATTAAPAAPQQLTFGQGEGRQPAPEYPPRARREGQEGSTVIQFTVAEDGHIAAAEAVTPCRWPLLNEAALRAVRERWHFTPGKIRLYQVSIRFELTR